MPGALLAEPAAVVVHAQQRGGGVRAQRVQAEPGVGHPRVEPYGRAELLLGLPVSAHRVGVDTAQPGQLGRSLQVPGALRAEVHPVPHKLPASTDGRAGTAPGSGLANSRAAGGS